MDLVVGDSRGRLSYFQNDQACRKTGEDGACSGNGVCGAFKGGKATCECLFTFEGNQCDACRPSKAAKESAADPESSPTSPLGRGAPPQEDEEAPAAPAKN